jgi:hypothetical protein
LGAPPPIAVKLPEHVRDKDNQVAPYRLDVYDQLTRGAVNNAQQFYNDLNALAFQTAGQ